MSASPFNSLQQPSRNKQQHHAHLHVFGIGLLVAALVLDVPLLPSIRVCAFAAVLFLTFGDLAGSSKGMRRTRVSLATRLLAEEG